LEVGSEVVTFSTVDLFISARASWFKQVYPSDGFRAAATPLAHLFYN